MRKPPVVIFFLHAGGVASRNSAQHGRHNYGKWAYNKTYAMPCSLVWLFGFNVCNIEITDDGEGHECDECKVKKYGQLVTMPSDTKVISTRHTILRCDELPMWWVDWLPTLCTVLELLMEMRSDSLWIFLERWAVHSMRWRSIVPMMRTERCQTLQVQDYRIMMDFWFPVQYQHAGVALTRSMWLVSWYDNADIFCHSLLTISVNDSLMNAAGIGVLPGISWWKLFWHSCTVDWIMTDLYCMWYN